MNGIEGQAKRQLSETERAERRGRQIARYGRTYRQSIHSQIREMRDKIDTLQTRETDYKKYRSFVSMIESEVVKLKSSVANVLNTPQRPDVRSSTETMKPATTGNAEQTKPSSKATDKPPEAKSQVPDEYKPSAQTERLQKSFGSVQTEQQPVTRTKAETDTKAKSEPVTTTERVETKPDTPSTKIEAKTATASKSPNPDDYKIKANAGTQKMLDKIQTELKAHKVQEAEQRQERSQPTGKADGLKGTFRKPERPPVNEEDHRRKTQAEAQKKRQNIPPEYRAESYEAPQETQQEAKEAQTKEKPKTASSSAFSQASAPPETSKPPRPKMSDAFNMKSGIQDAKQNSVTPKLDDKPEIEF